MTNDSERILASYSLLSNWKFTFHKKKNPPQKYQHKFFDFMTDLGWTLSCMLQMCSIAGIFSTFSFFFPLKYRTCRLPCSCCLHLDCYYKEFWLIPKLKILLNSKAFQKSHSIATKLSTCLTSIFRTFCTIMGTLLASVSRTLIAHIK